MGKLSQGRGPPGTETWCDLKTAVGRHAGLETIAAACGASEVRIRPSPLELLTAGSPRSPCCCRRRDLHAPSSPPTPTGAYYALAAPAGGGSGGSAARTSTRAAALAAAVRIRPTLPGLLSFRPSHAHCHRLRHRTSPGADSQTYLARDGSGWLSPALSSAVAGTGGRGLCTPRLHCARLDDGEWLRSIRPLDPTPTVRRWIDAFSGGGGFDLGLGIIAPRGCRTLPFFPRVHFTDLRRRGTRANRSAGSFSARAPTLGLRSQTLDASGYRARAIPGSGTVPVSPLRWLACRPRSGVGRLAAAGVGR